ncbi:hypothetical protein GCM10010145_14770 [Streptomyces ruber]|uniref:Sugar kinase n=2 Tax=Streptomyces TaxID=1883 RepID=A0A918EQ44_9ACTN|nr:sugar kinase [Streptomyces ruber]GGQ46935.1 hypothetical protein GCM10010145_14770 [Streptomyces ruber]
MTAALPRQPAPPDEPAPDRSPENRRRMIRRRALTLVIIVLLIGIPAGYLAISAGQSRDSGRDKEEKYSATGLTAGYPSRLQRRLYHVPVPRGSWDVAYYETNNWKTSRLYVQFLTNDVGLERFLGEIGTSPGALEPDDITISDRDRETVGWDFSGPGPWSGLVREQPDPAPTHTVVVNRSNPEHPMVYVVSTTTP